MSVNSDQDIKKSRKELIAENELLRRRISELEALGSGRKSDSDRQPLQPAPGMPSAEKLAFELFSDYAPFGMALLDPIGNYKYINHTFIRMFGYTSSDLDHWWDWFVRAFPEPNNRKSAVDFWTAGLSSGSIGRTRSHEYWVTCSDGAEKLVLLRLVPLPNGYHFIIFEDVTERERKRDGLEFVQKTFDRLMGIIPDMISIHDRHFNIVFSNWQGPDAPVPEEKRILGARCYHVYRGLDHICPDCPASEVFRMRKPYRTRIKTSKGAWVEFRLMPLFDERGEVDAVVEWVRDISRLTKAENALRESEERFKTVFETATDCIFLKDRSLKYTLANPAAEKLFDMKADEIPGLRDLDIFDRDTARHLRSVDAKVLEGEVSEEEHIKSGGGGDIIFNLVKVPLRNVAGMIIGLCGIARDVTHTRLLESRLTQAQKMEAIGTLAGGIAHDFNNLLTGIIGYSELAMNFVQTNSPIHHHLKGIFAAAENGRDLTTRILTFSRKTDIQLERIDLNRIIKRAQKLLVHTIPKMIVIDLDLDKHLGSIQGDATLLEQIIMNFGANAADAMPDGGRLLITTQNISIDRMDCSTCGEVFSGEFVQLTVSDTGHGMDRETLDHIFEPFFTTKKIGKGTGLGLSTALGIVNKHGGHIVCRSQVNAGATFQLFFPRVNGDYEFRESESVELIEFHGRGETVLVVDDEEAIRDVVAQLLEMYGYKTIIAASGEECIDIYRTKGPRIDLILLDLSMPGMGGQKCLKELRSLDPAAKVVVVSGYSRDSKLKASLAAGASGYIVKPFKKVELLPVIKQILS